MTKRLTDTANWQEMRYFSSTEWRGNSVGLSQTFWVTPGTTIFWHRLRFRFLANKQQLSLVQKSFLSICSLQCRRIFGAGALNNPSLLSSWARKRERAGASQKVTLREKTTGCPAPPPPPQPPSNTRTKFIIQRSPMKNACTAGYSICHVPKFKGNMSQKNVFLAGGERIKQKVTWAVTFLWWWSLCVSEFPELCWWGFKLLTGPTTLDRCWGQDQAKDSPWPSRLGVGHGVNYPYPSPPPPPHPVKELYDWNYTHTKRNKQKEEQLFASLGENDSE